MFRLAIVVCNSGLGHVKRVMYVLDRILKETSSIKVVMLVERRKLLPFENIFPKKLDQLVEIRPINANVLGYEDEAVRRYGKELRSANMVWSDNLLFPLKINTNVVVTGSFLWLDEIGGSFARGERSLLEKARPMMIGCRYFATPSVRRYTDFRGVGIYDYAEQNTTSFGKGRQVLLAVGNTRKGKRLFTEMVGPISEVIRKFGNGMEIMVDKNIFDELSDIKNIRKLTIDVRDMKEFGVAVVRPGLGTVCDLWRNGAVVFPIFEENSVEMANNAEVIIRHQGVGRSDTAAAALKEALKTMRNGELREQVSQKIATLEFGGVGKTAKIIYTRMKEVGL